MKLNERGLKMKKLNEKELSKITGGFGMLFDPTVSFMQIKSRPTSITNLFNIFNHKTRKHHK